MAFRAYFTHIFHAFQTYTFNPASKLLRFKHFIRFRLPQLRCNKLTRNKMEKKPYSRKKQRGAFIVFEGCDRCGKSTQSQMLVNFLQSRGILVRHMGFPARQSNIGQVINSYLTNKEELSDQCIHLLFSANRWEFKNEIKKLLEAGTTLVVDRYSYSGVAYSVAKGLDYDWCMAPEMGLIQPDAVFYLKTSIDTLLSRGNFGEERYEKKEFQLKVSNVFNRIYEQERSYWHVIDASLSINEVQEQISAKALRINNIVHMSPLRVLR